MCARPGLPHERRHPLLNRRSDLQKPTPFFMLKDSTEPALLELVGRSPVGNAAASHKNVLLRQAHRSLPAFRKKAREALRLIVLEYCTQIH